MRQEDALLPAPCQCRESSGKGSLEAQGAVQLQGLEQVPHGVVAQILQRPACWTVPEAHSRRREESSGSRRSIAAAALLAQERLTVFCIYLLSFLFSFFFKECSCGYMVSLSEMYVCSSVSLHLLPCDGQPRSPSPALTSPATGLSLSLTRGSLVALP